MNRSSFTKLLLLTTVIIFGGTLGLLQAGALRKAPVTYEPLYPQTNDAGESIHSVFVGRIPCNLPRCEKMKVLLVFYEDRETHVPTKYWLAYIGVGDDSNERTVLQGNVTVRSGVKGYPNAQVFELVGNTVSDLRLYWQVNEDILLPLDETLNPKVGNSSWGYMLSRDKTPYGPRTYQP